MRHHKKGRTFGRERKVRVALLRSLARSLIEHERIVTTEAKAKELRPFVERLLTYGKKASLAHERLIVSRLGGGRVEARKLISTISPRYKDRHGGYTSIVKLPVRKSDSAKMASIRFI